MEVWRRIGFAEYEVSSWGRIRNHNGIVKTHIRINKKEQYELVWLRNNGISVSKTVHKLVAEAFMGPCPEGMEVNHKDTIKFHNWLENLEYLTHQENMDHAVANGLMSRGSKHMNAKVSEKDVLEIRRLHTLGVSGRAIARRFGIWKSTVGSILHGKSWKWLEGAPRCMPSDEDGL